VIEQAPPVVTWIKVDKPKLDLIGLILNSLGATMVLAISAVLVGALLGLLLILRRRRHASRAPLIRLPLSDAPEGDPPGPMPAL
jgi:ABC-type amino acid transport system permease subunit